MPVQNLNVCVIMNNVLAHPAPNIVWRFVAGVVAQSLNVDRRSLTTLQ